MKTGGVDIKEPGGWLIKIVRYVDRVTWVVLFALMCMITAEVLMRKILNSSILGYLELTELMMVLIVFCSLAFCEANDGHIKIDLIMSKLSPRAQAIFKFITQCICFILFTLMSWALFRYARLMKESGEVSVDLSIPIYPFVYSAAVGCGLLALVLLLKSILAVGEVPKS